MIHLSAECHVFGQRLQGVQFDKSKQQRANSPLLYLACQELFHASMLLCKTCHDSCRERTSTVVHFGMSDERLWSVKGKNPLATGKS